MFQVIGAENFGGSKLPDRTLTLTGRHVALEVLQDEHTAPLATALEIDSRTHDGQWRYLPYGPFHDRADFDRHVENFAAASSKGVSYAIIKDGTATGICAYLDIRPGDGSIEIGHLIFGPTLRRSRAASEAIYLLLLHAFEVLHYRRVVWKCDNLNEASKSAAQRFGFTPEGLWRKALVVKGRNRDTAWFSVIDSEWTERKRMFEAYLSDDNFDTFGKQRESLGHFR